jgi:hypothetical protein
MPHAVIPTLAPNPRWRRPTNAHLVPIGVECPAGKPSWPTVASGVNAGYAGGRQVSGQVHHPFTFDRPVGHLLLLPSPPSGRLWPQPL